MRGNDSDGDEGDEGDEHERDAGRLRVTRVFFGSCLFFLCTAPISYESMSL